MIRGGSHAAICLLVLVAFNACNGPTETQPGSGKPTSLIPHSGDDQLGAPNTTLPLPLKVEVHDRYGDQVKGAVVEFSVISTGGGSVASPTVVTDAQGLAQTTWTLGPALAIHTARAVLRDAPTDSVLFTASTIRRLAIASGDFQLAQIGQALSQPVVVLVTEANGTPASGVTVDFAVQSGGGGTAPATTVTDGAGLAGSVWTLGATLGDQALLASAGGIDGSPVQFAATGQQPRVGQFVTLTTGDLFTCGLTASGAAFCWGMNDKGQLGDGTLLDRLIPTPVMGGHSFTELTAGVGMACGLTVSGAAYCWGNNSDGQLGAPTGAQANPSPVAVTGSHVFTHLASSHDFTHLGAGRGHTCGIAADSSAFCWGDNSQGQLGIGTVPAGSGPTPSAVVGGLKFIDLTLGGSHTCGLTDIGQAQCWGAGTLQLGDGSMAPRPRPAPISGDLRFTVLAAGTYHTCGLTAEGQAYCWGDNYYGQLGVGHTLMVVGPIPVCGGLTFTQLGTAGQGTAAATSSGAAYVWGNTLTYSMYIWQSTIPMLFTGDFAFSSFSYGWQHACGITAAGDSYCWGYNLAGELGDGSLFGRATPSRVSGW